MFYYTFTTFDCNFIPRNAEICKVSSETKNVGKAHKYRLNRHLPTYEKIIKNLYSFLRKISFPVDNVDEDRYHTCYNIMYVLYHSDAEKFLQYCEKIKEDCDNMSRHRIDVLIEEIVKK